MFVKMYEIGEDIETIWQEKYPEKEHEPLHTSFPCGISECENIRDKCKDEIPYETSEIYRIRKKYSYDREGSRKETEDEIGWKMHSII